MGWTEAGNLIKQICMVSVELYCAAGWDNDGETGNKFPQNL